ILAEIESRLGTVFVDSEGHLALLAEKIKHSEQVKTAEIYIDGFVNFTTREYEIIFELMKHAKNVTIALPMDNQSDVNDEQELFFQSANTAERLVEMAKKEGIEIDQSIYMTTAWRYTNSELAHLEEHFD